VKISLFLSAAFMAISPIAHASSIDLPLQQDEYLADGGDALDRVTISENDYTRLLNEIRNSGVNSTDAASVVLTDPLDKKAYETLTDDLGDRIASAITSLATMKPMVIRYALLASQPEFASNRNLLQNLTAQYSSNISTYYSNALNTLLSANSDTRRKAMDLCVSELCVARVSTIMDAFVDFAFQMNTRLKFNNLNEETHIFWNFENPFLKTSFSKAFHKLVPANQETSAFRAVAAGLYAPLSVVGVTTFNLVRNVVDVRWSEIKLWVPEVEASRRDYKHDADNILSSEIQTVSTAEGRAQRAAAAGPVAP
jgi:hypothetical protein